jgi:hypothetical protein
MPGLPALELVRVSQAELEDTWSGTGGPALWQGRLGCGHRLTIEQGVANDLRYTYARHASFRLDLGARRVECAVLREGMDWQRVLIGKVVPSVSVMYGYEALHAGVVDSPEGVVALLGTSGSGKSTLVAELVSRGWPLFADDELTLERGAGGVRAHPGSPHMSVAIEAPLSRGADALGRTLCRFSDERWLIAGNRTSRPRPVYAICRLARGPGSNLAVDRLSSSPMHLVPYMLGLSTSSMRRRSRFQLYSDLVESSVLLRLTGDATSTPSELADTLQEGLAQCCTRPVESCR